MSLDKVNKFIEDELDRFLKHLSRLVQQPSIAATGEGTEECAELLVEIMKENGIPARTLPVEGGPPVVYGELRTQSGSTPSGREPPTLIFYDHYDVQPPDPLDEWESPPFEPQIRDGKIYGRGTSDNKGNIISRIHAVQAFLSTIGDIPVNVKFFVEGEEEIGSPHLPPFIDKHKSLFKANCGIWEFGGVDHEGRPNIWLGLKGMLYVELRARGSTIDTHSARAPIIPNAAWRLVWALNTLKNQDERILIEGFYDDVLEPTKKELELIEKIPYPEEIVKKDLGLKSFLKNLTGSELVKTLLLEPTCTICGIQSGYTGKGSKTVLPSTAMAKVDFRLVANQRPKDILEKLRNHLDRHGFNDIEIIARSFLEPAKTPVEEDFVQLVIRAAEEVYQKEAIIYPTSAGSGPLYLFTNVLGIPMVSVGVGYPLSKAHAPNEHIRIKDYVLGTKLIARIMSDLGK